ncbi:hypothetical protein TCAL_07427 [Tigriopus californicus]|uniref:Calcium-activated chloride channel N-terminal domain-containing protein n=1 Tax=Tigriopus californicus TaxID=6832 RepID=A0A553PIC2_TIGCA|nr:calcium-activated chloride channel regulator 1-like [Tigriopus californicus]TRY77432.1 hypothetical protein TCAL_07427 [Tigriopus californicus]
MAFVCKVILALVLGALCSLGQSSMIQVQNGIYNRITVNVNDVVPKHLCNKVLDQLEALLTETSASLHELTESNLLFGSISVILPKSWESLDCLVGRNSLHHDLESHVSQQADIQLAEQHPIFGANPWTTQFGPCGVSGRGIDLPYPSLTRNHTVDDATSRAMLKAWIQYRWGVFEEQGFEGDTRYPSTYMEGEMELENRGCDNKADQLICPLDKYDHDVTTKQNILCNGKSIREVILASQDLNEQANEQPRETAKTIFVDNTGEKRPTLDNDQVTTIDIQDDVKPRQPTKENNSTQEDNKYFLSQDDGEREEQEEHEEMVKGGKQPFRAPIFNYVLPRPELFVLVLDRSSAASSGKILVGQKQQDEEFEETQSKWETLQQSLFQLISRLPVGAELSIITYGQEAQVNLPPTLITDTNKEGLHGRIPRRPLSHDTTSCLDCALKTAFKVMQLGSKYEGRMIVASMSLSQISAENLETIEQFAVPVYSVSLSGLQGKLEVDQLTKFGDKFVVTSPLSNQPEFLTRLSRTFTSVVRAASDVSIVSFHQDHRVPNIDNIITGNFVVEEHLRKNLRIVVTADDERDIEVFEVLSPTGRKHSFPTYEHSMAYFNLAGLNEPGIWSFSIRLYQTLVSHYPVYIEVLGEPNDDNAITLETWVHQRQDGANPEEVYVYAQVKQGDLPVLDAEVVASILRPGDKDFQPVLLQLRDMGTGYPDITQGDGIYSAYFTDFSPQSGYYQLSVSASDNSGNARTPKLSASIDADTNICCGSALPFSYTVPTGPFQRFAVGSSFLIEQTSNFYIRQGSRLVNDIFPPNRITDFWVDNYLDESLFVTLKWTAPGGDYDQGKAFRYEIRCYTSREALRDSNFADMSIPVHASLIPQPEENGSEQRCTVGVPWPNEVFYYAIVAFDEAGNRGKISNTISVFIKEDPSTLPPLHNLIESNEVDHLSQEPLQSFTENNSTQIIYIVVGSVSFVLLILIILCIIAIRKHYRIVKGFVSNSNESSRTRSIEDGDEDSSLAGTLKKIIAERSGKHFVEAKLWSSAASSPTSDYSSQKSPLPSISETLSWKYRNGLQKATSQELPGVHRIHDQKFSSIHTKIEAGDPGDKEISAKSDCGSRNGTDCSTLLYESSDNGSSSLDMSPKKDVDSLVVSQRHSFGQKACQLPGPPPRVSVMEDYSVYRDLSNLSNNQNDYFSVSQLPAELQNGGHIIAVPPYYDVNALEAQRKRHESLV